MLITYLCMDLLSYFWRITMYIWRWREQRSEKKCYLSFRSWILREQKTACWREFISEQEVPSLQQSASAAPAPETTSLRRQSDSADRAKLSRWCPWLIVLSSWSHWRLSLSVEDCRQRCADCGTEIRTHAYLSHVSIHQTLYEHIWKKSN